jgi:hypothetical protein
MPPNKELSTKELSEVFSLLDKTVEIITQNDSSTQCSDFFRRGIENLSRPYKELYEEKRKQAKQLSLLNNLRWCRKKNKVLCASRE